MTRLAGGRVLVTGAASGIGRLMAEGAARRGASLVLWDVDAHGLERLRAELAARGHPASAYRCDLAQRGAIQATAAQVLRDGGPVDVLINNAGVVEGRALLDCTEDAIERTFRINALAPIHVTRAFLPGMLERDRGHVVNIASAAGLAGVPRLVDYSASKFAVVGFDEALRLELAQGGSRVRTTLVCPFYIDTGLFAGARTRFGRLLPILQAPAVAERILAAIESDRPRLLMPPLVHLALLARALPVRGFDALMRAFGITRSMDHFTGRGAR